MARTKWIARMSTRPNFVHQTVPAPQTPPPPGIISTDHHPHHNPPAAPVNPFVEFDKAPPTKRSKLGNLGKAGTIWFPPKSAFGPVFVDFPSLDLSTSDSDDWELDISVYDRLQLTPSQQRKRKRKNKPTADHRPRHTNVFAACSLQTL